MVDSKKLTGDFEDGQQLLAYLSICNGDTIEIMGEGCAFVENILFESSEYRYIRLNEYKITGRYSSSISESGLNEAEIDRLHDDVWKNLDTA